MNTLTQLLNITDEQINQAFANIGCDVEVSGECGDPDGFTVTAESLDDFETAVNNWSKCEYVENGDNYIIFRDAATRSGDQRCDLYVIDFGAQESFENINSSRSRAKARKSAKKLE